LLASFVIMMMMYDVGRMRTIIDLPDDQLEALAVICRRRGISRAEAIRQAIANHVRREREASSHEAFGLWSDLAFNARDFERGVRREWGGADG
jgi:hypothetical protein